MEGRENGSKWVGCGGKLFFIHMHIRIDIIVGDNAKDKMHNKKCIFLYKSSVCNDASNHSCVEL
jgi:hypothetical protein